MITWNATTIKNNSLVALSVVLPSVGTKNGTQYPIVCKGITGGQWYQPNGALFPLVTNATSIVENISQYNASGGVQLYNGNPPSFPRGVQCCTNTTTTLCVGIYSNITTNDTLSEAATCK